MREPQPADGNGKMRDGGGGELSAGHSVEAWVATAAAAMAEFHEQMSRSLQLSAAVFKNSPMIKIAEAARCVRARHPRGSWRFL